jgi:Domain of unknown function (DUF4082)/PEP-CTERM motif
LQKLMILAMGATFCMAPGLQSVAAQFNPQLFFDQNTAQGALANPPFTLGWSFTTNNAITVNGLGVFDDSQDGLTDSYEVGLWDSQGDLLAETTVLSGTTDPLVNQWRYVSMTPVTLAADETYYVGALYLTSDDGVYFPAFPGTVTTTANIIYQQATYAPGPSLTDPTTPDGTPGFFGPNISIGSSTIPEPSTWAMMLLGFAGLAFAGYRASRRAAAPVA